MKLKIALCIIATTIAMSAQSQNSEFKKEFCIGANFGATYPTVSFDPTVSQKFNYTYSGGLSFRYITQKHFGLQWELNYSQRGWTEANTLQGTFSKNLDYVELPLLTHIYFGKEKSRFFVNLGPKIRYLIYEKSNSTYTNPTAYQQITAVENKLDYSILGGSGLEVRTKKAGYFQLEARYDFGLGDIFKNSKADYFARSSNQAFSINFVYFFNVLNSK